MAQAEHIGRTGACSALWLPIFDELADPVMIARLAAEAEEAGWHGISVWDHLRWRAPAKWSAVTVGGEEPFDGIWLRLTATESSTCRIAADRAAVDAGLCTPALPIRSPVPVDGGSLAHLTLRREEGGASRWELGAIGHGPTGPDLADRMCAQIHAWDRARTARPVITVYPVDTPDNQILGAYATDKQHTRLIASY